MEKLSLPNIFRIAAAFFVTACILIVTYLACDTIAPLLIALLFAIILRPAVAFMMNKMKFPHVIAVTVAVVFSILIVAALIGFLGYQLTSFAEDLPAIKEKLIKHYETIQNWLNEQFGLSKKQQEQYLQESVNPSAFISMSYVNSITNGAMYVVLVPIFTFLILIYRNLLLNFIIKLVPDKDVMNVKQILENLKVVVRSYVVGLVIQVACVSILTGLGYFIIGMKYYIFLGILTGLLNLIPYIGILISGIISCIIALTVGDDLKLLIWLICVNMVVQFIDNNIISPKVVGSKVSINALASMIGVIIGGSIAGVAGMFLAIPVLAMVKVIFDSTKGMEPYGYLIGDDMPKQFNWNKIRMIYDRKMRMADAAQNSSDIPTTESDKQPDLTEDN